MANLGPSEQLLRGFQDGAVDWKTFRKAYLDEILTSAEFDAKNKSIRNHGQKFTLRLLKELSQSRDLTFLCHCAEDTPFCHRHVLKELIESSKI